MKDTKIKPVLDKVTELCINAEQHLFLLNKLLNYSMQFLPKEQIEIINNELKKFEERTK